MDRPIAILLMTRPRDASARFVAQLPNAVRDRVTVCTSPLLEIEPLAAPVDWQDAAGVIFTSANAVEILSDFDQRRDLPAFCVGDATAQAARRRGWSGRAMGGNADALVAALLAAPDPGPLLHLGGVHTRGNIVERLRLAGRRARAQAIYDQIAIPLSEAAGRYLRGTVPVIAPIFSPRTARHFARQVNATAPLLLAALSLAVAKPLQGLTCGPVRIAQTPTTAAMSAMVETLLVHADRVETGRGGV